jgi:hypothetical protein
MDLRQEHRLARAERGTQLRHAAGAVVAAVGGDLKRKPAPGERDDVVEGGDERTPGAVAGGKEEGT